MLAREIRQYIQEPVLAHAGWNDDSSKILIYGTGMIETGYQAIMQRGIPKNGGIGFYQEQPSDYADLTLWLKNGFNRAMLDRVLSVCNYVSLPPDVLCVAFNIAYATLICRMHYHRIREPLPKANDAQNLAQYHYKYYNGNGEGKTDVSKNTIVFERILNNEI